MISLFLFTVDVSLANEAAAGGVAGLVIDGENLGKSDRQRDTDTEINYHSVADLARIRAAVGLPLLRRINGFGPHTFRESEESIVAGADEILLPMVRHPREVEDALAALRGRRPLGILVETRDAIQHAEELGRLPLSRVYVGLHDLAIDRGLGSPFISLIDGTIDSIRGHFPMPFGIAGATLPSRGSPIPARLLIGEIVRLQAHFTFLRRSFLADTQGTDLQRAVTAIREFFDAMETRTVGEITRDREEFVRYARRMAPLSLRAEPLGAGDRRDVSIPSSL